jgi:hypothetical protein
MARSGFRNGFGGLAAATCKDDGESGYLAIGISVGVAIGAAVGAALDSLVRGIGPGSHWVSRSRSFSFWQECAQTEKPDSRR